MGGIRSTSTRRAAASTAVAGQAVVINAGGGTLGVAGAVVSASTSISLDVVTPGQTSSNSTVSVSSGPIIANVQYLDANNQPVSGQIAVSTIGGNILINGTGFVANSNIYVNNSLVTNTFISTSQIRAVMPSGNVGNVALMIFTPTSTGFLGPNVRYSGAPSWSTSAISSQNGGAVSTQLVATGDSTLTFSLSAGSLPTGLSLSSNGIISGTPTGYNTTTVVQFAVTATDQEGQQSQQVINYTVTAGDQFITSVAMLISASDTLANSFVTDSSITNALLTISGDVKPNNKIPFASNPGTYGSAYFDGNGDWVTGTVPALGSGDLTVEFWMYQTSGESHMFSLGSGWGDQTGIQLIYYSGTNNYSLTVGAGSSTSMGALRQNAWTHIAIVRSSGTVKLYFNGTASATTFSSATNLTATALNIGYANSPNWAAFAGYMTNFRMVRGTAVYTGNFTPTTSPLTAISGTTFLALQSNQPQNNNVVLDESTNYHLVTRTGSATSGTFSPYGERWSYYFDGTGDYLSIASNAAFNINVSSWTIEAWINPSNITGNKAIAGIFQDGVGGWYFGLVGSTLRFSSGAADYNFGAIAANVWTHVAAVRSGNNLSVYINGVQSGVSVDISGQNWNITNALWIGNMNISSWTFTGYISNVRLVKGTAVYTSAFTPSTTPLNAIVGTSVLTCASGYVVDKSPATFTITRNGDVTAQKFSPFAAITASYPAYSLYFDGSGDSVNVTTNQTSFEFGTGDFTIEFWTYLNNIGGYGFFYDSRPGGTTSTSVGLFHQPNTGVITLIVGTNEVAATASGAIAAGAWYHVALCRSSGSTRFFVNGVQSGGTYSDSNNYINNANRPIIGTDKDSQFFINGYMSNLRVVKGTGLYTSTFTPSTAPLTAISGTSLLAAQSNTISDISTNNNTLSVSGNTTPRSFNPFTTAYSGSQTYSKSVFGGSMYFDGNGDYFTVPDSATLELGSSAFTIEGWIYPTSLKGYQAIASKPGATDANGWILIFETNNTLSFYAGNGSWAAVMSGAATPNANSWNHVAVTRTGNVWRLFLNGVQANTVTNALSINDLNFPLYVGWYPNFPGSTSTQAFGGYISDFRVIKGTALYTSPFVPPAAPLTPVTNTSLLLPGANAGISDNGMITDFETAGDAKELNDGPYFGSYYSNYFDGTGDYLTTPTSAALSFGTGDFTVEFWVNSQDVSVASQKGMFQISDTAGGLKTTYTTGITCYFAGAGTGGISTNVGGTDYGSAVGLVQTNTWYHVAVTRSSGTVRLFLNGTSVASGAGNTANLTGTYASIGGYYSTSFLLPGYISNLRVVKGTAVYTANFTPSTTPLTAISGTSLLTCQSNSLKDNSSNALSITRNGDVKVSSFNTWRNNFGSSYYFDGTGDYAIFQKNALFNLSTLNFTLETWVYFASVSGTNPIFSMDTSSYPALLLQNESGTLKAYATSASASWDILNGATFGTVTAGQWYHVALTRSGSSFRTFLNGTLVTTATSSASIENQGSAGRIGNSDQAANLLNGYVSDLRLTVGVARYTSGFTVPDAPLFTL